MALEFGTDAWNERYEQMTKERSASEPKPFMIATPEWGVLVEDAINQDAKYAKLGKGWQEGIVLRIQAKPEIGLEEDLNILLDLYEGKCRSARPVPKEVSDQAPFIMVGPYEIWKSIVSMEQEALKLVVKGDLKMEGELTKMLRYVGAAKRLTEVAASVDCRFPDELSPEELEEFKVTIKELRGELGI